MLKLEVEESFKEGREKAMIDKMQSEVQALNDNIEKIKVFNSDLQMRVESKDETAEELKRELAEKSMRLEELKLQVDAVSHLISVTT